MPCGATTQPGGSTSPFSRATTIGRMPQNYRSRLTFLNHGLTCHSAVTGSSWAPIRTLATPSVYPRDSRPLISTLADVVAENWIPTGSVVLWREIAQDYPEWARGIAFGDWPMQVVAAKKGKIAFLDAVMGFYRLHPGGQWSGLGNVRRFQDTLKFYLALRSQVPRRYLEQGRASACCQAQDATLRRVRVTGRCRRRQTGGVGIAPRGSTGCPV